MTRVVVGYGRTGRSVARFFEERALPFWVADDHLDLEAKTGLDTFQHCEGCSTLAELSHACLLYTSPSPRDATLSRMPSSA